MHICKSVDIVMPIFNELTSISVRIALLTIYFTCCSIPTEERKQGNSNAAAYADKSNTFMSPSQATQLHVLQQVCVTLGSVELWVSSSLEVLCGFWGGL